MEDLIPLVNKLQDVFNSIGSDTIDLPQIVVVGSQSSGKSSVLENLVQRDFLPRGTGIVTRRPLVLQLIHVTENEDGQAKDYGEFLHAAGTKFADFAAIRKEIEAETIRVAGQNKGISKLPIHLKIFSNKVLNLTLVDLPGLTKIPVGDQPTDIEKQARSLILDYITKPNSIILAVSPANVDLVNSESLKLARQVDSEGSSGRHNVVPGRRTIGVLTKLDLMDAGTNALDILTGRVLPLKLGFIGVVNRSQQDIMANKPMGDALKAEADFFKNHPAYRNIAVRCGTPFLAKTLNIILMNHIRERLPDMKTRINALIGQTQQELSSYGDITLTDNTQRAALILKLLNKFATDYMASVDGTLNDVSTKELSGGARIYYIFNNVFGAALSSISPCGNLTEMDIRMAIRNSSGPRPSLFVPEMAFDLLVKPQIKLLEPPSLRCVELVYQELMKISTSCGSKELNQFPRLHAKLLEIVSDLLRERLQPTTEYVESLIAVQRAYINTNHPDFIGASGAFSDLAERSERRRKEGERKERRAVNARGTQHVQGTGTGLNSGTKEDLADFGNSLPDGLRESATRGGSGAGPGPQRESFMEYFFGGHSRSDRVALLDPPGTSRSSSLSRSSVDMTELEKRLDNSEDSIALTEQEEMETQLIRSLITSYFNIVRKMIQDLVPKSVMHLLVNNSRDAIQNRLVSELYKEELFADLLQENENLANDRQKCKTMLEVYKKAFAIVNETM